MELPTFILGLSTLVPRWRSNVLFAVTFGGTQIAFHLVPLYGLAMCVSSSYFPWQLADARGRVRELRTPVMILTLVFSPHAMWFRGCITTFVRRHKVRVTARNSSMNLSLCNPNPKSASMARTSLAPLPTPPLPHFLPLPTPNRYPSYSSLDSTVYVSC
ncbi:hypothetical protein C8R45DRAFT_848006 [Mycena sanguinolenta]|nr:hypothetical protein C8R45DRAFT_848006 [Mycena sanguinolenta]